MLGRIAEGGDAEEWRAAPPVPAAGGVGAQAWGSANDGVAFLAFACDRLAGGGNAMAKRRAQKPEAAFRPLQLDPQRAMRADRPPYGDRRPRLQLGPGSWSTTSSAGRRCLASMRNPFCGSRKNSPRQGVIAPDGFHRAVQAVGPVLEPSPTRWGSVELEPVAHRGHASRGLTGGSSLRRSRRSAASRYRILAGAEGAILDPGR